MPVLILVITGVGRGGFDGWFTAAGAGVAFGILVWYAAKRYRYPFLVIGDERVSCETILGKRYTIDPHEYSLVISTDWLGFRKGEKSDITIAKHEFRSSDWDKTVSCLKSCSFEKVIEGIPGQ